MTIIQQMQDAHAEHDIETALRRLEIGEVDPLNGVAENIIVGQPVNLGTGAVKLAMDSDKLGRLIKTMPEPKNTIPEPEEEESYGDDAFSAMVGGTPEEAPEEPTSEEEQ